MTCLKNCRKIELQLLKLSLQRYCIAIINSLITPDLAKTLCAASYWYTGEARFRNDQPFNTLVGIEPRISSSIGRCFAFKPRRQGQLISKLSKFVGLVKLIRENFNSKPRQSSKQRTNNSAYLKEY